MPDGPKVGSVALSPRGDWRMPSDASVVLWRQELTAIQAVQQAAMAADSMSERAVERTGG
jgi:hypothetical protein